ncbi:MAG TPA: hypothetical protein VGW33_06515 [Terriglobia bacterium]|nr:hypothetical protein [Terriglobia bacterium]
MEGELIFVYNADASPAALALDLLHKTFSPETYPCNLCHVTYGVFTARKEWTEFIKGLSYRTVFLHRDEFQKSYPALASTPLPAVFRQEVEGTVARIVSAEEINSVRSVEEMKTLMRSKLAELT